MHRPKSQRYLTAAGALHGVTVRLDALLAESEPESPGDVDWGEHNEHGPESCFRCAEREIQRERNANLAQIKPLLRERSLALLEKRRKSNARE